MGERALADRSGVEFNCDCRDGPLGRGVFAEGDIPRHQLAWLALPTENLIPRSIGQCILLFLNNDAHACKGGERGVDDLSERGPWPPFLVKSSSRTLSLRADAWRVQAR